MTQAIVSALQKAYDAVKNRSVEIRPSRWQSMDVSKLREATTREVLNHTVQFPVGTESLDDLRLAIKPNLPWADDHFLERVGGVPLNPGIQWARWPWGNSANSFRREEVSGIGATPGEKGFDHTYMERMWPKEANRPRMFDEATFHHGIRYRYGDAMDVVEHLAKHPDSRQAYLPIWFPEDTGKTDVRVPCTLGYHFIHRNGYLHCSYYIRSCDLYRHFRDDVYLTVRLQLWMLEQLRRRYTLFEVSSQTESREFWQQVQPGLFTMHIVSLHCFINDCYQLWPGHTWR